MTAIVHHQKIIHKINGLGIRTKATELTTTANTNEIDHVRQELRDYRRDTQDAITRMGRVEKGMEGIHDEVTSMNLGLGQQLHNLGQLINDKDTKTQVRLTRIETLQQTEKKIGPIPLD